MKELTLKQQRFADEYIISGNAYRSAIKVGYSKNYAKGNAVKLLENVRIKTYIGERLEELKKTTIATQSEVLERLTSILRQESTEEIKQLNPITGEMVEYSKKPSTTEVINAGKELLKRYSSIPLELQIEKYKLEMKKLEQQTSVEASQEDKLIKFTEALRGQFKR